MEGVPKRKQGHIFSCNPQCGPEFLPFTYNTTSSEVGPPQASQTINEFEKRQSAGSAHKGRGSKCLPCVHSRLCDKGGTQ